MIYVRIYNISCLFIDTLDSLCWRHNMGCMSRLLTPMIPLSRYLTHSLNWPLLYVRTFFFVFPPPIPLFHPPLLFYPSIYIPLLHTPLYFARVMVNSRNVKKGENISLHPLFVKKIWVHISIGLGGGDKEGIVRSKNIILYGWNG